MSDDRYQVTDPRFTSVDEPPEKPARERRGCSGCMTGCLIVFGILMVLAIVAGIWAAQNWRGWTASIVSMAIKYSIEETGLPLEERQAINAQIDRVADAFRENRLTLEQAELLVERLTESPLIPLLAVSAAERRYFDQSDLTEEEKAAGRRALRRFLRGAFDGAIDQASVDAVISHIAEELPDGTWQLRLQISDQELREFLQDAQRAADTAGVDAETEITSPSEEFKRIIDEALIEQE